MPNQTSEEFLPLTVSAKPDLARLHREFQSCAPMEHGWDALRNNDDVRYCRWSPQWSDGRKHSTETEQAWPFDEASDARVNLADSIISELSGVLTTAFWQAVTQAVSARAGGQERASRFAALLQWMTKTKQRQELTTEVELSAQYMLTYGVNVLNVGWAREVSLCEKGFTLEQLAGLAQQAEPGSPLALLPALILDPTQEEAAAELASQLATEMVQRMFAEDVAEVTEEMERWKLSTARARKLVRALREEGAASVPLPYVTKNQPFIAALKPFEDVFWPAGTCDLQRASVVFRKEYLTAAELQHRVLALGWDAAWVDECVNKCRGYFSTYTSDVGGLLSGDGDAAFQYEQNPQSQDIEVIHAFYPQLDADGVRTISYTVFHPKLVADDRGNPKYGYHGPLGYEHMGLPFVAGKYENRGRRLMSSRGVPQLVATRQRALKVQLDAITDMTSLSVFPPLLVADNNMGTKFKFGPGRVNYTTPNRAPAFMEIPSNGANVAFELWDRIERSVDNDFGRLSADVPPARTQARMQMLINQFLQMWSLAFEQQFHLMCQYLSDAEYMKVTGDSQPLPKGREIFQEHSCWLAFDARNLDAEHVAAQFNAISQGLIPLDTANVIDRSRYVALQLRSINPSIADEVVQPPQAGQAQVWEKVQRNFLLMFSGNPPELGQDDNPTAPMELQMAQQIMGANKKYQQALAQDLDFAEKVKTYVESLQFNVQQQQNKQVGRVGVKQEEM